MIPEFNIAYDFILLEGDYGHYLLYYSSYKICMEDSESFENAKLE